MNRPSDIQDPYERLGIPEDATRTQVEFMYRQKCLQYNRFRPTQESEADFDAVRDAYACVDADLKAEEKRQWLIEVAKREIEAALNPKPRMPKLARPIILSRAPLDFFDQLN